MYDRDADNKIKVDQLGTVLRALNLNPTEKELKEWVGEIGGATVDFDNFLAYAGRKMQTRESEEQVKRAFQVFDREGNGYIKSVELRHILTTMGETLTDHEVYVVALVCNNWRVEMK